jgi:flagellar capping protein FliD
MASRDNDQKKAKSSIFFEFGKKIQSLFQCKRRVVLRIAFERLIKRTGEKGASDAQSITSKLSILPPANDSTLGSFAKLSGLLDGLSYKLNDEEFSAINQACHEAVGQLSRSCSSPFKRGSRGKLSSTNSDMTVLLQQRDKLEQHIVSLEKQLDFVKEKYKAIDNRHKETTSKLTKQVHDLSALLSKVNNTSTLHSMIVLTLWLFIAIG